MFQERKAQRFGVAGPESIDMLGSPRDNRIESLTFEARVFYLLVLEEVTQVR